MPALGRTGLVASVVALSVAGCGDRAPAGYPGYVEAEYVRVAAPFGGNARSARRPSRPVGERRHAAVRAGERAGAPCAGGGGSARGARAGGARQPREGPARPGSGRRRGPARPGPRRAAGERGDAGALAQAGGGEVPAAAAVRRGAGPARPRPRPRGRARLAGGGGAPARAQRRDPRRASPKRRPPARRSPRRNGASTSARRPRRSRRWSRTRSTAPANGWPPVPRWCRCCRRAT